VKNRDARKWGQSFKKVVYSKAIMGFNTQEVGGEQIGE